MRIAVVGGGFGRRVVAPVFAATDGCEVVDVVSARDDAVPNANAVMLGNLAALRVVRESRAGDDW